MTNTTSPLARKVPTMTPAQLTLHVQTWYANWLRDARVDVVEVTPKGVMFGAPDWHGGTFYWQFELRANGCVAVRSAHWLESGRMVVSPWTVGPDVDALLQLDWTHEADGDWSGDLDPTEKPSAPRTNYRYR